MTAPRFRLPGVPWKLLGVAGVVGVAATGVAVARSERARRAVSPQEVRDRLHERYAELPRPIGTASPAPGSVTSNEGPHHD